MPLVSHACSERAPLSWRCITNEVWVGAASSRMMRCGTVTTAINSTVHATSTTPAAAGRQTAAALPLDIPPPRPPRHGSSPSFSLPLSRKKNTGPILSRAGQGDGRVSPRRPLEVQELVFAVELVYMRVGAAAHVAVVLCPRRVRAALFQPHSHPLAAVSDWGVPSRAAMSAGGLDAKQGWRP